MMSYGVESYLNNKHKTEVPQWMRDERLAYCDQDTASRKKLHPFIVNILFSIFF